MIGWLKGDILDKSIPGRLVVDVNGVGYDVETSLNTYFQVESLQNPVGFFIHTVVREDALLLFGFYQKQERTLFRTLIKVNGVGPKLALSILSSVTPDEFVQTVRQGDSHSLTRFPGIGKKTAERLLIELKDAVKDWTSTEKACQSSSMPAPRQIDEAIAALIALGYKPAEASRVARSVDDGNKSSEQLIRDALKQLA
ncbi:Holliday junction branch migration protein RuvA [Legionella sp. W05-934-2]|jgi:Holliday junction DNA helicase RuvA|uniref:Holliday junction branch migration protein RuvA n=1 Tax=Legionella sp. W05-934-2 TaxID=1198649 RepID=UPI0034622D7B